MEPSWDIGMKIYSNVPGHMTKIASMPIYDKNFRNLLLWNQAANDLENLYTALGTTKFVQMMTLG